MKEHKNMSPFVKIEYDLHSCYMPLVLKTCMRHKCLNGAHKSHLKSRQWREMHDIAESILFFILKRKLLFLLLKHNIFYKKWKVLMT